MVSQIMVLFLLLILQRHILLYGDEERDGAMLIQQWRNRLISRIKGAVLPAINHYSAPYFTGQNGPP